MYNIIICDDEKDIVSALKIYLSSEEYKIFTAYNGRQALEILENEAVHLILLDIMMPELDGIEALKKIRKKYNVPIILLTAKSEDYDIIHGLNNGADDYITKPFKPVEVMARVRSQLRRYMKLGSGIENSQNVLRNGGIELNRITREVTVDDEPVKLTPTEFDILKLFMERKGEVITPQMIYQTVWNDDMPIVSENNLAVHIRHLREKIEINPSDPRYLKVVWGKGYKLEKV